jgi:hypothetical protein
MAQSRLLRFVTCGAPATAASRGERARRATRELNRLLMQVRVGVRNHYKVVAGPREPGVELVGLSRLIGSRSTWQRASPGGGAERGGLGRVGRAVVEHRHLELRVIGRNHRAHAGADDPLSLNAGMRTVTPGQPPSACSPERDSSRSVNSVPPASQGAAVTTGLERHEGKQQFSGPPQPPLLSPPPQHKDAQDDQPHDEPAERHQQRELDRVGSLDTDGEDHQRQRPEHRASDHGHDQLLRILGQVAGALDAAHRRALVHRDVKPANVLLDEEGHVYLTDFGITKQLGGASTDTGRMVGTLDYLAPEQVRGDPVDGRTDIYALDCVLYECLFGTPPFRRATEAETMWAHMRDEPAPLRDHPTLDPVVRKALAKDPEKRYGTCTELIDAATGPPLVPLGVRRRARGILAGRLLLLAAAIALAIVAIIGGEETSEPLGNGVAAIDASNGGVTSFTESQTPPGNVAVGEGGVWTLDNEGRRVTRIDPDTKEVTESFETPGVPTELAAGEGALWIGIAGGRGQTANVTVSVARMDPRSGRVTRTVGLRGDEGAYPAVAGTPRIAVGAGAVWAANPDGNVSRIDPATGGLVDTVETRSGDAWTIAAGEGGVWFLSDDEDTAVSRIDPRTNRVTQRIPLGASNLAGLAVGAGSVWAAANDEGVVWRIDPQRPPILRTIDVSEGVSFLSFGEGAVWTGNYVDGTVARIDPRTNAVTARTSVGAPQALAAGAGSAWVSVAGGTTEGALTASSCGAVASGVADPDVLIASDLPLQGPLSADPRAMEGAIRHVIERRGFRAGEYTVGYQSCDVSTPQTGAAEFRKCAANATAFAHAKQLLAVIGPYSSY